MIIAKPFYMIRHGESIANRDGYFSGNRDVPLTELGIKQAEAASAIIENLDILPSAIFHSHLERARNTALIINQNLKRALFEDANLGEHHFGDWEGQSPTDIRPLVDKGVNPPNGEPHAVFHKRVGLGINTALQNTELPLIVCHGGVFRGFGGLYGHKIHQIRNCILYYFEPDTPNKEFPWIMTRFEWPETQKAPDGSPLRHAHEIL